MEMQWISAPIDRPRFRATDDTGRRCREPALWDDPTDRPLSTRCRIHGGLADATLMGWCSTELKETPDSMGPASNTVNVLATSVKKMPTIHIGGSLGVLPAIALAGALWLSLTVPALADFESAVAAYERGDYQEAQLEFESLAAAGDQRVEPYLNKIRQELANEGQTSENFTSPLSESVTSFFGESETSDNGPASRENRGDSGSSTASRSAETAPSNKPAGWEPWTPFEEGTEPTSPPSDTGSDIVSPQRRSIWSVIFHLPGDASVIGLQYVAHFLSAENLSRELQYVSRHSEKMTLSILAAFWWLVIIKVLVGVGVAINRFMKAATTMTEKRQHG